MHFDEQGSRLENSVRMEQYRVGEKILGLGIKLPCACSLIKYYVLRTICVHIRSREEGGRESVVFMHALGVS